MDSQNPFIDHAVPILAGDPAITDEQRADLHDIFHGSKDPAELAQHLQPLAVPDDTKRKLYEAKKLTIPPMVEVLNQMAKIDPQALDLAETHPNVLKALTAANTPEKGASGAAGASTPKSKGNTAGKASSAPTVKPDVPPTPSGHALVKASDGGLHHIPAENVDKAKEIDPELQVLHVEP